MQILFQQTKHFVSALWLVACFFTLTNAAAAPFIWIEGEKPSAINYQPKPEGVGHPEYLSEQKWLKIGIEADKVEATLPPEGILIKYNLSIPQGGSYEVWNRVGFEFVRSPFEWRIDSGEWTTVSPDELTTDLMELSFWSEIAWLKLGARSLTSGDHQLEFRLTKSLKKEGKEKGKPERILYTSDALVLSLGEFHPYSHYKPGEDHQTDQDREAAKQVFQLPEASAASERTFVKLAGLWEIARHDEQLPLEVASPITNFPAAPRWSAIQVPGDKNTQRHDLIFAHRLWYRTRVNVPASLAGRSFFLVFPQNNLNTTVYVNGQYCGFDKNPFARVQIDVSKGMKPGLNEIWVGIKDAWYGYSQNSNNPLKLRKRFNLPMKYLGDGFQDLAYPIWNHPQSGMLVTPELVAAGSVYACDVFAKPSAAIKPALVTKLTAEVTLLNPSAKPAGGEVRCEVRSLDGQLVQAMPPQSFNIEAEQSKTIVVAGDCPKAQLWWPDAPQLYSLWTKVLVNGREVDLQKTTFGFREWTADGPHFKLNGIRQHLWADCFTSPTPAAWAEFYRKSHQTTMRFWGTKWQGLPPEEALDFLDRTGVVVRRSGTLDGEAIGYMAIENDPDLQKLHGSKVKVELMKNWQDQLIAQIKGERNHPSINIWSIENEWLYINCINLYGGMMDEFESWVTKVVQATHAADPTRFYMTDGGGANKDQSMPVHGNHYVFESGQPEKYPALAYEANPTGGGRGRWVWDQQRPRFLGEDYFANGINPFDYSYFGGEATFQGKAQAYPAGGVIYRMLTKGYRWAEYGGWHFWMGQHEAKDQYTFNAPRAVFARETDWTFASGQKVPRSVGIFNDTRFDDPISFTWKLTLNGKDVAAKTTEHRILAGENEKFQVVLNIPTVQARSEGELLLTLSVKGQEVFRAAEALSVLPPASETRKLALQTEVLAVHDPKGSVTAYLQQNRIPFTPCASLKSLPETARVLLIGPDSLEPAEATSSRLAAWASAGRRVLVLEQANPLKYQGLPAEMNAEANEGRTAFLEDTEHPVLRGLKDKDFFTWSGDEVVYRNAYEKPTRGGKSLVQCHRRLKNSALVEVPVGDGLLLLCQLQIGAKLSTNAVAQTLLHNLLDYAANYKLVYRSVAGAVGDSPQLAKALDTVGLEYTKTGDALSAITKDAKIAVIHASPVNLKQLVNNLSPVKAFLDGGGYMVLNGLTPEGLADYNRLVGFEHMIRPFGRERVSLAMPRHPLTAGLTTGDVVMRSGERIFGWTSDEFVASDMFSYIVDYRDVAPFAQFEDDFKKLMVNGMVSADAWKYIVNLPVTQCVFKLTWPKPQTFEALTWIGNTFYWPATQAEFRFDGKESATFNLQPNNEPQDLEIKPSRAAREIVFQITKWNEVEKKNAISGLDNIHLYAQRPPEFLATVKPLLNIGGMMFYQRGQGGIVLANLAFKESEAVPENATKKRAILAAVLRNLKAPFSGGRAVIAGARLNYAPVDISKHCTQFRNEKGWFGDPKFTFAALPSGKQTFAGVPFSIFEFETSPVPTVIMLAGNRIPNNPPKEVRGIPLNRKADALFFLHTARLDQKMNNDDVKKGRKFELARYMVTYADGETADIPVYAEIDIHDYKQKEPLAIPGAQIAWTRPWETGGQTAVAYLKQWTNPRPNIELKSLDLVYGKEPRGVPVLLGLTSARAE